MKLRTVLTRVYLATSLSGCAVYTPVSIGTTAITGKSPGDHALSLATDADCNIWNNVVDLAYYCEYNKNPARTYNRNPF
jgi:hypothetical protein